MKNHLIAIAIATMLAMPLAGCGRSSGAVEPSAESDATWSDNGAFVIAADAQSTGYLEFSMNSGGQALLTWRNGVTGPEALHAVHYDPLAGWSDQAAVNQESSIAHQVLVAENGDCFAVWEGNNAVGTNRRGAQSEWGEATGIPPSSSGTVSSPILAAGPGGTAFALWKEYAGAAVRLVAGRYETGTGWTAAEPIQELTSSGVGSPALAVDASGNALAVWYQYVNYSGIFTVMARRYETGIGWGEPEILNSDGDPYPLHAGFDASGNALVVWGDIYYDGYGDGYRRIVSRRYSASSGWEPLETRIALPVDTSFIIDVEMAINPDGDAVLVWMQDDISGYQIWSDLYRAGSGWTKNPVRVSEAGDAQDPQVAIDPAGNAVVVWRTVFDASDIWSARYSPDAGWSAARMMSMDGKNTRIYRDRPFVGMDAHGNALVVWEEFDSESQIFSFWGNRVNSN